MAKTYEELLAGATQIKNNELPESNTHSLVGGQLVDMVEKQKEDSERIDNVSKSHKGYFQTLEQLKAKYPTPKEGETAWVGKPYPGNVYDVVDGAWHDTGVPANEGGGSGTSNYNDLENKPSIGNVSLEGNKTLDELGIASKQEVEGKQDTIKQVNVNVDNETGTPLGSASVSGSTLNINLQNIKGKPGEAGPANTLTIGTVTPSDSPDEAGAVIRGEAPNQVIDLTLPRGRQGNSGITGKPEEMVVVNNLDGGESEVGSIKVLSAEQGKVLNQKIISINDNLNGKWYNNLILENGTLDDATGQVIDNQLLAPKRLRSINYETNNGGILINKSEKVFLVIVEYFNELGGNYISRIEYTSDDITLDSNYKFFKVIVKKNDESGISPIDVKNILIWTKNKSIEFENGTLDTNTGQVIDSPTLSSKRLRTVNYQTVISGQTLFNNSNGQLLVLINYYNSISGDYVKQIGFTNNNINIDSSYKYYKLIVKKYSDVEITPTEGNSIVIGDGGLSDNIESINKQVNESKNYDIIVENGTLDDSTGQVIENEWVKNKRLRSINYEKVEEGAIIINNSNGTYQIIIEYFEEVGGNYVKQEAYTTDNIEINTYYPYYKLIIKRTDEAELTPDDIKNIIFLQVDYNLLTKLSSDVYGSSAGESLEFENGTLDSSTGQVINNYLLTPKRLRNTTFNIVGISKVIKNFSNGGLLVLINYYNEIDGNYVKQIDFSSDDILLDSSYKYYKLIVKKSNDGEISPSEAGSIYVISGGLIERVSILEQKGTSDSINDILLKSKALLKDFELPDIPAQNGTDESALLNLNTVTVAEYYEALTTIINNSNGYIKKEVCGKDASNIYEVWKLTLKNSTEVNAPRKVLIDANVHNGQGDAIDAAFTVLWLCKFLSEEHKTNSVARYIRNNYDFVIIPLANPWGLDNKSYGNANGVNINRNYDYNFVPNMSFNYNTTSGPEAWSEPETRYIRDMVLANKDAYFWMDLHSYGDGVRKKAFYVVAGDVLHPYNADRARRVFQYTKNLIDGIEVQWYDNYDSNGWGPAWGAKIQGIYSPNLECGNALTDGVKYSSGALTSDLYDLIGFLMFNN